MGQDAPEDAAEVLDRFAREIGNSGWLTEDPETHLGPKLDSWLAAHDEWALRGSSVVDGWWVVHATWLRGGRARDLRAAAVALIGSFAESQTMVRQVDGPGDPTFEVLTGQPAGASGFAAHGHLVRVVVERG